MTLKQARNLAVRQIGKITPRSLRLILKKKPSPLLLRSILLSSNNKFVVESIVNHFVELAKSGDVRAKFFLNRCASEKFNKNAVSREKVLNRFRWYACEESDSWGLRGLLAGVKDSVPGNRCLALSGLNALAKKGDVRTLPGLLVGANDSGANNRAYALEGLRALSEKGDVNALRGFLVGVNDSGANNRAYVLEHLWRLAENGDERVLPGLLIGLKDSVENNRRWALHGLRSLAKKENSEAKKVLKELGE